MPFTLTLNFPASLTGGGDQAATFKSVVAGAAEQSFRQNVVDKAKATTPYPNIADAYSVSREDSGNTTTLTAENSDQPVWAFIEKGTRAHDIYPRNGSVLAFQANGEWVFARHVHHPGTKAQGQWAAAWEAGIPAVMQDTSEAFGRWLRSWGGAEE